MEQSYADNAPAGLKSPAGVVPLRRGCGGKFALEAVQSRISRATDQRLRAATLQLSESATRSSIARKRPPTPYRLLDRCPGVVLSVEHVGCVESCLINRGWWSLAKPGHEIRNRDQIPSDRLTFLVACRCQLAAYEGPFSVVRSRASLRSRIIRNISGSS